ncbi:RND family transporter [Chloroflexota bacterium]
MNRLFRRLGEIIESKYLPVIIIAALLIGAAGYGATRIKMDSGMGTILPADSQVMIDSDKFSEHFGGESIIILVTADTMDELLANDVLVAMDSVETDINGNAELEGVSALSPALLFKQANGGILPATADDAKTIMAIPLLADQFSQMLFDNTSPPVRSGKAHAFIVVASKGNIMTANLTPVTDAVTKAVDDANFNADVVEVTVTGGPMIMDEVQGMMMGTMRVMMALAIALLFIIIAVIFKVRGFFAWRWLPLGVVVIGTIYTFGVMGYLSVPLTMVSMAVFPVLLGLGIDYGIQLHNRYDEDSIDKSPAQAIIHTITHMGPVVGIALVAACLGLCAMFFSPVPMVRDFGLMLIIGMICSYVVAVFPLPVILYLYHRRKHNNNNNNGDKAPEKVESREEGKGFLERGLHRIAPWVIRSPKIILPIALFLTVGGVVADFFVEIEFDETKWISENSPVMQKVRKLSAVSEGLAVVNVFVEGDDLANPETMQWMQDLKQEIIADRDADVDDIKYVSDVNTIADTVMQSNGGVMPATAAELKAVLGAIPDAQKSNLIKSGSDSYPMANIIVTVTQWNIEVVEGLRDRLVVYLADAPDEVNTAVTGGLILQSEVKNLMTGSRSKITFISIGFILAGLFFMFKFDIIKAIVATLPVVLIIGWSALCMYALGMKYTPLTAALGALVIAIGVEFTILLMSRYYEERGKGEDPLLAMTTAMTRIGRAITASALTTIGGFAALLFAFDFIILQDFGIITMINVFFALAVTILVLPSLVVIVDKWRERRKRVRIE